VHDPNAEPTIQDIANATARYLTHHELAAGETVSHVVTLAEVVEYFDDDRLPIYRRVRITDARTHPGILESLVRHTAEDLAAEQHPAPGPNSGRFILPRRSS
jgi:hypothetical protein